MSENRRITVIGAGAWGTAIAVHLARIGLQVDLWAYEAQTVKDITTGENRTFLPNIRLPNNIVPTDNLATAIAENPMIFFAVPTQHIRETIEQIPTDLDLSRRVCINLAKGIEAGSNLLPSELLERNLPRMPTVIALSGPSFAHEVAIGKPTVVVVAGNPEATKRVQHDIASNAFRIYRSSDRLGVELGAALKNVLALAAGMSDGLGLGEDARAAIIVRGLAEMQRLSVANGADLTTVFGIAGLGDLVLTCTSGQSRNHQLGVMIGQGQRAEQVLSTVSWVAEGVHTAPVALKMAEEADIELPITEQVVAVISGRTPPAKAVEALMTRPLKEEFEEG